ncbi:MAG: archaeosortase/exosortase family protein [Halioglobus sp.]
MMEFTASSTVWLIQHSGVPVYREGLWSRCRPAPGPWWRLAAACVISSHRSPRHPHAYLTYRSLWRRAMFLLVSLIVPIFANTARAYIIVMLGHWSDMTIATGVDHLIYGWVFFGLVMFLLFWLGAFFRGGRSAGGEGRSPARTGCRAAWSGTDAGSRDRATGTAAGRAMASTCRPPSKVAQTSAALALQSPPPRDGWTTPDAPPWQWQPDNAVTGQSAGFYKQDDLVVGLIVQFSPDHEAPGEVCGRAAAPVSPARRAACGYWTWARWRFRWPGNGWLPTRRSWQGRGPACSPGPGTG